MKRLTLDLDDDVHRQFKSKAAAESLQMKEILTWAVADYLIGKWKPRPYDRQPKKGASKAT